MRSLAADSLLVPVKIQLSLADIPTALARIAARPRAWIWLATREASSALAHLGHDLTFVFHDYSATLYDLKGAIQI